MAREARRNPSVVPWEAYNRDGLGSLEAISQFSKIGAFTYYTVVLRSLRHERHRKRYIHIFNTYHPDGGTNYNFPARALHRKKNFYLQHFDSGRKVITHVSNTIYQSSPPFPSPSRLNFSTGTSPPPAGPISTLSCLSCLLCNINVANVVTSRNAPIQIIAMLPSNQSGACVAL